MYLKHICFFMQNHKKRLNVFKTLKMCLEKVNKPHEAYWRFRLSNCDFRHYDSPV